MTASTAAGQTLVAGLGNIFLTDDGFGVEVVSRLAAAGVPDGVRVVDYGIRGMHLAYDLASGYQTAILVDAAPRGDAPGTVYVIEPDLDAAPSGPAPLPAAQASPFFDAHGMQPDVVFSLLGTLTDERPGRILVVGCEPASVEYGMGLSEPVAAAVDEAVRLVLGLLASAEDSQHQPQHSPAGVPPGDLSAEEEAADVPRHSR
jgi:hydrogenase maturation protease